MIISPVSEKYRVGTLSYTKAGLFILFAWMLWGCFCFTLMEMIFPKLMPLQLKALGASSLVIGLLIGTVPSTMNFLITPIISFRSDRFRSRWGRRIPFLLVPTPFVALSLVLLGFSTPISKTIQGWNIGSSFGISPTALSLVVVGSLIIGFQFFNMFVTSVYYYLFNDVVPQAFMGRFMSLFQAVANGASFLFNFYIFGWADAHMKEIFLGAALLYFISFTLMCWKVKEGDYPAPPPIIGRPGVVSQVKTYFRECFSHPFYLWFFASVALWNTANVVSIFYVFFAKEIGISLDNFGKVVGLGALLTMLLMYPIGGLVDRLRPPRVLLASVFLVLPCSAFFIIGVHSGITFFIAWLAITVPSSGVQASLMPTHMAILPKDRFGQFCSAAALVNAVCMIIATPLAGRFLDMTGNRYRYVFAWQIVCVILAGLCLLKVYYGWRKLGGPDNYVAPVPNGQFKESASHRERTVTQSLNG